MKYKIIASLLFTGLLSFMSKAQTATVKAIEVAAKFYDIYESPTMSGGRASFEKRKNNWYVKIETIKDGKAQMTTPALFYDGKMRRFIELSLNKRNGNDTSYLNDLGSLDIYNFDLQPYYGYRGWYKDVIKEYGDKVKLTDDELYALGRSYVIQSLAPVTLMNDAMPNDIFHLPFNTNAFSRKQLQTYSVSADSAIAKFRQLSLRNRTYPTKVGDICDKYAHEIVSKFHTLLTFSVDMAYKMILPRNIYKDSLLNANRARLKACPPDAVLYSSDDSDFYPILYLQQSEGLRKDVYLVNYALLHFDKFIYRATQPQFESKGIVLSVDTSAYRGHTNEYFFLDDSSRTVSAAQLTLFLQSGNDDGTTKVLAADHIDIPARDNAMAHIKLDKTGYMMRSHWVLFDLLSNLKGRKMCFPKQFDGELEGLNPYLKLQDGLFVFDN